MMRYLFIALGLLMFNPVKADTTRLVDDVRKILVAATKVGHGNMISSVYGQSGYQQLPEHVWREKYRRIDDFEWEDFYSAVGDSSKGSFIARRITYFVQEDVRYVLWVDKKNNLSWFQKKVPKRSILRIPDREIKVQFTAFIDYDRNGHIMNVHQYITHVDDAASKAEFSTFELSSDGEMRGLNQGDFDYYQITD